MTGAAHRATAFGQGMHMIDPDERPARPEPARRQVVWLREDDPFAGDGLTGCAAA